MPQINLLKQPARQSPLPWAKAAVWLMAAILLAMLGYYGWAVIQLNHAKAEIVQIQDKINTDQQGAAAITQKDEIYTRQLQIRNMQNLINQHVYWSQILPQLAQVTLKTATYSSLKINSDNTIMLSGSVPSLQDMDLYLRVFDQPQVYKYFNQVALNSFDKVSDKNSTSIKFSVTMHYDPGIIQYKNPNSQVSQ